MIRKIFCTPEPQYLTEVWTHLQKNGVIINYITYELHREGEKNKVMAVLSILRFLWVFWFLKLYTVNFDINFFTI